MYPGTLPSSNFVRRAFRTDPFPVSPVEFQVDFDKASNTETLTTTPFGKQRGIYGWSSSSCVLIGDGGATGTDDDRYEVMTELVEKYPLPLIVKFNN
jgi:hypothetical protein